MSITSTSVTISLEESPCTGGHTISDFSVKYVEPFSIYVPLSDYDYYYYGDYTYIYGISADQRIITISKLEPSTTYEISVLAVSVDTTFSSYSLQRTVTTLSPGM